MPQPLFYRHVMEDTAHETMQWLHGADNKGNCASPMTLIVFMSKPRKAEPTYISPLCGSLENSKSNLQQSSSYCIGLYNFHLCVLNLTPDLILCYFDIVFLPSFPNLCFL